MVIPEAKSGLGEDVSFGDYSIHVMNTIADNLEGAMITPSDIDPLSLPRYLEATIEGTLVDDEDTKRPVVFLVRLSEGRDHYHKIVAFCTKSREKDFKASMHAMLSSFRENE
ncbi:MAG: hypothetical protein QGI09_03590 [Dehalococcoidia bacterium]|jgi:hypothetical protein|nr:hypothetical protein [Dehalococcoidia bacterium]